MANVLVIGVNADTTYPFAASLIAQGHRACIALSREVALRKMLSGLIDTVLLDSTLDDATQGAIFSALQRSVDRLPRLAAPGDLAAVACAAAGAALPRAATARPRPEVTEGLMRAIAFLFGLVEGNRLGVAAEIDISGAGEVRGIATAIKARDIQVEFLERDASAKLVALPILGPDVPATARLHFPGGGVLRVEGSVRPIMRRSGATALRFCVAPATAEQPADVTRAFAPAAVAEPAAA